MTSFYLPNLLMLHGDEPNGPSAASAHLVVRDASPQNNPDLSPPRQSCMTIFLPMRNINHLSAVSRSLAMDLGPRKVRLIRKDECAPTPHWSLNARGGVKREKNLKNHSPHRHVISTTDPRLRSSRHFPPFSFAGRDCLVFCVGFYPYPGEGLCGVPARH